MRSAFFAALLGAATIVVLATVYLWSSQARSHEAPTGWAYDVSCCSNKDCREVPASSITETSEGITVPSGEVIPSGSYKIKQSKDEHWHLCTAGGTDDGRVLCIYRPLRGF